MKLAIVGSRTARNYSDLLAALKMVEGSIDLIVSGGANGADTLGEQYARTNNIPFKIHLPEWEKYGLRAAYIRNKLIVDDADLILALWDGKSKGTRHTIDYATLCGKPVLIHNICE